MSDESEDTTTVQLSLKKTTKNTDVYESSQDGPEAVTTLYVYKWWSKGYPNIEVTLTKK